MKKLKLFFVAMLLSAVAINSYAKTFLVNDPISKDGFNYVVTNINPYTVQVTSITKKGAVVVPSTVQDEDVTLTVTSLMLNGESGITSLELPNTITSFSGSGAYKDLTTFRIPASLTSVSVSGWFISQGKYLENWEVETGNEKYASEDGILYNNNYTELISIPGKKSIADENGVYSIREGVISFFTSDTSDKNSFTDNVDKTKLKKIILPQSFKSNYQPIRDALPNLEAFEVISGNNTLKAIDGVLFSYDGTTLLSYPIGKKTDDGSYRVPDGVTTIGNKAFFQSKFSELDLNGTEVLAGSAIGYCSGLTSLDLKEVTTMNSNSVNNCSGLLSIDLGQVHTMSSDAIFTCAKLVTVTIPATLTDLRQGAISRCEKLQSYIVKPGNPRYASDDGVLYTANKDTLLLYPTGKTADTYVIPESYNVKVIGANAFNMAKIKYITIPSTVETIGSRAFEYSGVQTMEFETPSSLKTIGQYAFHSSQIQNNGGTFELPSTVTSIGAYAFMDCKFLNSFNWPTSANTIPGNCFSGTIALKNFVVPDNVTTISNHAFANSALETIKVGKGVTGMSGAFYYATELKEVIFDEDIKLQSLGTKPFDNCYCLKTITLPKSVVQLNNETFRNCPIETIIVPDGSQLTTIGALQASMLKEMIFEGSSNVTSILGNAFLNCKNLTELHFPSTVKTIGDGAFKGCTKLESITFEGGEAEITSIGSGAFAECGLKSFDVPNKVETIGSQAFRNCDVLATVSLPAVTKSVDPIAFVGCTTLTAINVDKANTTYSSSDGILLSKNKEILRIFPMGKANSNFTLLPPSIITIGNYAFYDNSNLTNVTIPNKVKTIGKRAFGLCPNLNTVTMLCDNMISPDNIAQALNEAAFDDGVTTSDEQFSKINLNVRWNLLTQYQNNEYWSQFGTITPSFIDETSRDGGLNKTKAKEEFIAVSDNTVDLLSVDTDDETYVLPTTVKQGDKTYAVSLVGDYLFTAEGSSVPNVKEVVVPGNVEYIGARAFMTDASLTSTNSNVESVFLIGSELNEDLLSTARFELTAEDLGSSTTNRYDEFGSATKIYVRKSAEETYKTAWGSYADNISYKIPFAQTGEYGTFAREFDVDFSEVNGVDAENPVTDDPVLIAFTGDGKYNKNGNTFSVHMTSINLGDQTGKDGTYVPAGSGVLIKKYKDADLFYQIAETGVSEAFVDGNFMKGITLRPETIGAGSDVKRYYISGGTLHEMTKDTNFKNHKSYMELPADAVPTGAKVMLSFGNWDNEATGIESINANVDDNDNLYNLQGQRVNNAGKGIYIKNGKKILK